MSGFARLVLILVLLGTATAPWADDAAPVPVAGEQAKVELTAEEMRRSAEQIRVEFQAAYREVTVLRTRAQKQKDVIKLSCVNDKLVQLKAQMNIADDQRSALATALEKSTEESQRHYRQLTDTRENVRKIHEEAIACMGESDLYKQESGLEVQRPDIIDDPMTIDPYEVDPTLEIEPPGYASPFS